MAKGLEESLFNDRKLNTRKMYPLAGQEVGLG